MLIGEPLLAEVPVGSDYPAGVSSRITLCEQEEKAGTLVAHSVKLLPYGMVTLRIEK